MGTSGIPSGSLKIFTLSVVMAHASLPLSHAATLTVDSTDIVDDANIGDGACATATSTCTLRAAMQEAAALPGRDSISLPSGTFADPGTSFDDDIELRGQGSSTGLDWQVVVPWDGRLSAFSLSLLRGLASDGVASFDDCEVRGVRVSAGDARVSRAPGNLGPVVLRGGRLVLEDDTIKNSPHVEITGGSFVARRCTITECGAFEPDPTAGGAIYARSAALQLENCTISRNYARAIGSWGIGGGLYLEDVEAHLSNCTITDNWASFQVTSGFGGASGGGIYAVNSLVELSHCIVADNHAWSFDTSFNLYGPDCYGTVTSLGHDIIGDASDCTIDGPRLDDLVGVDPQIEPLADNGGFVRTHALAIGSPARDAGSADAAGSPGAASPHDARGIARPQGTLPDIGAVEQCAGSGDLDGDTLADACDPCPELAGRFHVDSDGDGMGDECPSCAEPSATDRLDVPPLLVTRPGANDISLTWSAVATATYEVHAGSLVSLRVGGDHEPIACLVATNATQLPIPIGDVYLLVGSRCGNDRSSLGRDSFGVEQSPGGNPCP